MRLFQLYWSSGSTSGTIRLWAPNAAVALATVRAYPSWFGLPHENPIVGRPIKCLVITRQPLELAA